MPIRVVPYDPAWAAWFAQERVLLEQLLAPWSSGGVHHIGSTSVPGLAAKPIPDMMAGVESLITARPSIEVLREHGWTHAPHRPEAYRFYRPPTSVGHEHTHHLHLTQPGSALWRERLASGRSARGRGAARGVPGVEAPVNGHLFGLYHGRSGHLVIFRCRHNTG